MKKNIKPVIDLIIRKLSAWSLRAAMKESNLTELVGRLRAIESDISEQYSYQKEFNEYWELKLRMQHAFQCRLMLRALESQPLRKITVVDIGDSAGTHMRYLIELTRDRFTVDAISVNLDPRAIEKISKRGQRAILCRAEDLKLKDANIDLFVSFQMVEHLHNPSYFFRNLTKNSQCNKLIFTVPYMKRSRVGLYYVRQKVKNPIFSEEDHIFELSPEDWELLILHSGWRIKYQETYYQYPRRFPFISNFFGWFWRRTDFEGFWGCILEKDEEYSNCYQDWGN